MYVFTKLVSVYIRGPHLKPLVPAWAVSVIVIKEYEDVLQDLTEAKPFCLEKLKSKPLIFLVPNCPGTSWCWLRRKHAVCC